LREENNDSPKPSLEGRVLKLENAMVAVETDIKWIKGLVAPTFLISVISLLLLIVSLTR